MSVWLCVCTRIYICTCIYMCIHVYVYRYIYVYIHTVHIYIYPRIHISTCIHIFMHISRRICAYKYMECRPTSNVPKKKCAFVSVTSYVHKPKSSIFLKQGGKSVWSESCCACSGRDLSILIMPGWCPDTVNMSRDSAGRAWVGIVIWEMLRLAHLTSQLTLCSLAGI